MEYKKFVIENYRAIKGPLAIDVEKRPLLPIIGVNESGKTTILHALFAFDYFNDKLNEDGRHLRDTSNLYTTSSAEPIISAEVEVSRQDWVWAMGEVASSPLLSEAASENEAIAKALKAYGRVKAGDFPLTLRISRNLTTRKYNFDRRPFSNKGLNNLISRQLCRRLPYILYFDDFRDSVEEKIVIKADSDGNPTGWLAYMEQLFKQTDSNFSVFSLKNQEVRLRKAVLAKVQRYLNTTLTNEWHNFRLDDTNALQISIEYDEDQVGEDKQPFLKLEVVETDANGDKHYFFIRDRSKGFYWFYNFVMKLEFNPKVVDEGAATIYLLDEPGSYLHAAAQSKLCLKLKQLSVQNRVIYCTHSHYLLNPDVIPLNSIGVADKDGNGEIELVSIHEHQGNLLERKSAFQPVIDALDIKPFVLDLNFEKVIITEGIYDYYAIEMFKQVRNIGVLPSANADSIRYFISLMIAWRIQYFALWDNDDAGRLAKSKAEGFFGKEEAARHFFLLPLKGNKARNRIIQNLIAGQDFRMIKSELGLPSVDQADDCRAA